MIFDVLIRLGYNAANRPIFKNYRVPKEQLSGFLREQQDNKMYIQGVNPLRPLFPRYDERQDGRAIAHVSEGYVDDTNTTTEATTTNQ